MSKVTQYLFLKGKVKFLKCILFLKHDYYFKYVFWEGQGNAHPCWCPQRTEALESHGVEVTGDYEPSEEELRFPLEE